MNHPDFREPQYPSPARMDGQYPGPPVQPQHAAPKPKKRGGVLVLAAIGVACFLLVVALVDGWAGGADDAAAPAPSHRAQPTVNHDFPTYFSVSEIEAAVQAAGVGCDGEWVQGPHEHGFDIQACGNYDGSTVSVAYSQDGHGRALAGSLQAQTGSDRLDGWMISADGWVVVVPKHQQAKKVHAAMGGEVARL